MLAHAKLSAAVRVEIAAKERVLACELGSLIGRLRFSAALELGKHAVVDRKLALEGAVVVALHGNKLVCRKRAVQAVVKVLAVIARDQLPRIVLELARQIAHTQLSQTFFDGQGAVAPTFEHTYEVQRICAADHGL
eukprot:6828984-Prymnesium_polylepis.1